MQSTKLLCCVYCVTSWKPSARRSSVLSTHHGHFYTSLRFLATFSFSLSITQLLIVSVFQGICKTACIRSAPHQVACTIKQQLSKPPRRPSTHSHSAFHTRQQMFTTRCRELFVQLGRWKHDKRAPTEDVHPILAYSFTTVLLMLVIVQSRCLLQMPCARGLLISRVISHQVVSHEPVCCLL